MIMAGINLRYNIWNAGSYIYARTLLHLNCLTMPNQLAPNHPSAVCTIACTLPEPMVTQFAYSWRRQQVSIVCACAFGKNFPKAKVCNTYKLPQTIVCSGWLLTKMRKFPNHATWYKRPCTKSLQHYCRSPYATNVKLISSHKTYNVWFKSLHVTGSWGCSRPQGSLFRLLFRRQPSFWKDFRLFGRDFRSQGSEISTSIASKVVILLAFAFVKGMTFVHFPQARVWFWSKISAAEGMVLKTRAAQPRQHFFLKRGL